jgi:hypothetical protein
LLLVSAIAPARAQVPFGNNLVPTRTALARLGLERHWTGVVPLTGTERLIEISISDNLLFTHTNHANFSVYDAESGQFLWSANLGIQTGDALPASVNSYAVCVTNANYLFAFDRRTGRLIWRQLLDALPSSPTACDEDRVMVGLGSGKLVAYNLKAKDKQGKPAVARSPTPAWNWQAGGAIVAPPLPAGPVVAFGSLDGKVYVALAEVQTMLYRFVTGGEVAAPLGSYETRTLLIPSTDKNVYAMDLWTAEAKWSFPSGAPVKQTPLVADKDVYVVNEAGSFSALNAETGVARWTTSTHGGRLIAISGTRVYLESHDEDLFIVDRATGNMLADPRATLQRAGVNLRDFALGITNNLNDRLYLSTPSGLMVCLREVGQVNPRPLRDPKAQPLGYIPPKGIDLTPGAKPPAAPEQPATPPAENAAPGEEKPEGKEAPPAEREKEAPKEKEEQAPK